MKNVMKLALLGLLVILFSGCEKNLSELDSVAPEIEKSGITLINIKTGETIENYELSAAALESDTSPIAEKKGPNNENVSGHYTAIEGGDPTHIVSISFSAHRTNGGVNGQGQVKGFFDFHFDSNCVSVDGNLGTYGGIITSVADNGGKSGIAVGSYFYTAVIDNGEGANAAPDQTANAFIFAPFDYCAVFSLPIVWYQYFGGFSDVIGASDQIQVK